jgi:effector-binding domain-containing protein
VPVMPYIIERAEQPYVAITGHVQMAGIGALAGRLGEIFGWLGARGISPAGPPFLRYNVIDMDRELVIEAGVPVASAVDGEGEIRAGTLPAGRYAALNHTGDPATLLAANKALLDWASAAGLSWDMSETADGQRWGCRLEISLTDPAEQPDMSKWETQLAFRLAG